jgi:hypothetical protein
MALIRRRITFWMTSDALVSNQPSAIQAMEATMKIMKPATVTRAFKLTAKSDAARTIVTAANVLRIASSSIPSFPLQPPDLLGPDDDFLLGKLALQPLPQGVPVGTINFLCHDFDDGDAVFLRPAATARRS